jgi:hypothetical protein
MGSSLPVSFLEHYTAMTEIGENSSDKNILTIFDVDFSG